MDLAFSCLKLTRGLTSNLSGLGEASKWLGEASEADLLAVSPWPRLEALWCSSRCLATTRS